MPSAWWSLWSSVTFSAYRVFELGDMVAFLTENVIQAAGGSRERLLANGPQQAPFSGFGGVEWLLASETRF